MQTPLYAKIKIHAYIRGFQQIHENTYLFLTPQINTGSIAVVTCSYTQSNQNNVTCPVRMCPPAAERGNPPLPCVSSRTVHKCPLGGLFSAVSDILYASWDVTI